MFTLALFLLSLGAVWGPGVVSSHTNLQNKVETLGKKALVHVRTTGTLLIFRIDVEFCLTV